MIIFKYQFNDQEPTVTFELPPGSGLDTVIDEFEHFLQAAGYSFDGRLMLVVTKECDCSQDDVRNCPHNSGDEDPIRYN